MAERKEKMTTIRLTASAEYYLQELSDRMGLSRSAVIEQAIRLLAKQENVPPPDTKLTDQ